MSRVIPVSRSKYRVAQSDLLPYEKPIFFSNRFFSRFLKYYGVVVKDGRLVATKHPEPGLNEFLCLIGGDPSDRRPCFQYYIAKTDDKEGRLLSIIHPYHQVRMVEFYDRYKTVMLDFCQKSHFSIRHPVAIVTLRRVKAESWDFLSERKESDHTPSDQKTFFSYSLFDNINEFYDDDLFLQAESKYGIMSKSDLEKCFESIRPELLSKAMFGMDMSSASGTFAGEFFELNQSYLGKDKGIVIGPEFSRIYAEIILQSIDLQVERELDRLGINMGRDYMFYRYVDDGFLFCMKRGEDGKMIQTAFYECYDALLEQYGLHRKRTVSDESKDAEFLDKPFMGNITAGKIEIQELLDDCFANRLKTLSGFLHLQEGRFDDPMWLSYPRFIRDIRSIMRKYNMHYKDVMSFLLGSMQRHLEVLMKSFNHVYRQYYEAEYRREISEQGQKIKNRYQDAFLSFAENMTESLFFLFRCDPRMSTSIKVVGIIDKLQLFIRGRYEFREGFLSHRFPPTCIRRFDSFITHLTDSLFSTTTWKSYNQLEILNFLELQKKMSPSDKIRPVCLEKWLDEKGQTRDFATFFSVFEIIHFIGNDRRYEKIKLSCADWISAKIHERQSGISDTEITLTLIEALCCPWFDLNQKKFWLRGIEDGDIILTFVQKQRDLFIQWRKYTVFGAIRHISNNSEAY